VRVNVPSSSSAIFRLRQGYGGTSCVMLLLPLQWETGIASPFASAFVKNMVDEQDRGGQPLWFLHNSQCKRDKRDEEIHKS